MSAVSAPGALIAALPGILGFIPEESLVVVAINDGAVYAALRVDLSVGVEAGPRLACIVGQHASGAVLIVVTDDGDGDDGVLDSVGLDFICAGVEVLDSLVTDARTWVRPSGGNGSVDDMSSSPVTAAAVLHGRPVQRTRAEMVAVLAPTCPMSVYEVENDDSDVAVLGRSLIDGVGRDRAYALAITPEAAAVEQRLLEAARVLPGEYRTHALATLGFFAYCRGDGAFAGEALVQSLALGRTPMAVMLDTALQAGVDPSRIRELAAKAAA